MIADMEEAYPEQDIPDVGSMSDAELKELIEQLTAENEVRTAAGCCTARSTSSAPSSSTA